jgi:colanic acid biosynthesis glycosyl transferase WcaI
MYIALIDYGCHSFTYRLSNKLVQKGLEVKYFVNGSLESPNLSSLASWTADSPDLVYPITCAKPYGKMSLHKRLSGELEWGRNCTAVLEKTQPSTVIVSCVPLTAVTPIHRWAAANKVRFVYWLQDIQSRAIHDLLGRKLGMPGRTLGAFANIWEQEILENSEIVITISPEHEKELPPLVRRTGRHVLLENWANIEDIPQHPIENDWSVRHGLDQTVNLIYSGTLGMKHDLATFIVLAEHFRSRPDVRVVIVSSGRAADAVRQSAEASRLSNLIVLPFQPYSEVPMVLASATVLIAPLDASASMFCVPSKILSYLCAGRPTVISIDKSNSAAQMILRARAGSVVPPGDRSAFVAAVEEYLDDQHVRLATGSAARAFAEATFELDTVAGRFIDMLRLSNTPGKPSLVALAGKHN